MLKTLSQVCVNVNGKDHSYSCAYETSTYEAKEALLLILKEILETEAQLKLAAEAQKSNEAKDGEPAV